MDISANDTQHTVQPGSACCAPLSLNLDQELRDMRRYVLNTADYERSDRVWPADSVVFQTNSLSVAFGACGTVLFLKQVLKDLPEELVGWLRKQPLGVGTHPPGLHLGLAGIAYTFLEIGLRKEAESAMRLAYQSPLLYKEPNMLLGVAGWGFASLHLYIHTGNRDYLEQAECAGEHLLQSARVNGQTCCWHHQDEAVHYGFGYGASGIALFLLYLHIATGRDDFRSCAVRGLEFEIANKVESEVGWQWKRHDGDTILYPYWVHGSAGVGCTLIRFYSLLGTRRYKKLACKVASDAFVKYSFCPGLFEGLAGIGELMLDMFHVTGDADYQHKAQDIADTILWFKIVKPEGTAYPGRWLSRISNDYATGAAGIGLFFNRLVRPRRRLFVDIDVEKLRDR